MIKRNAVEIDLKLATPATPHDIMYRTSMINWRKSILIYCMTLVMTNDASKCVEIFYYSTSII